MKKENDYSLQNLVEDYENLFRKIDALLIRFEKQKTEKLADARNILNAHDPLMNAEEPPMVLLSSLLAALRRVHNVDQLRRLRYELAQIHETTVRNLDQFPHSWMPGTM